MKPRVLVIVSVVLLFAFVFAACSDADTASRNISKAADYFEIDRRIVFYNGITNDYILVIEGKCSIGNYDGPDELTVTCKVGPDQYKKHFLGLSDNVTYFSEQVESVGVNVYQYKVVFKPSVIVPDIEIR